MRGHFQLFACYPLAPVAFVAGGLAVEVSNGFALFCLLLCAGYYWLLLSGLWACRGVGGWAKGFYTAAWAVVWFHSLAAVLLIFSKSRAVQDGAVAGVFLTVFAVWCLCSLAGAAIAWRRHKWTQAFTQIFWPLATFAVPLLDENLPYGFLDAWWIAAVGFGVQGLQAFLLALSLEVPSGDSLERGQESDIGWE